MSEPVGRAGTEFGDKGAAEGIEIEKARKATELCEIGGSAAVQALFEIPADQFRFGHAGVLQFGAGQTSGFECLLFAAREGSTPPSTVCGKPSPVRAAGLSGLTSRPKTGEKVVRQGRYRYNYSGCRPGSPAAVRLRLTGTGLIQVSLNRS